MGQRTQALGATTTSPFSEQNSPYTYSSKFRASDHYAGHPVTGAIGSSSKPILVTALSITSVSGGGIDTRFEAGDSIPNSFSAPETTTADTLCYYGFRKTDSSTVYFKRGAGTNPNGIFGNGVSLNPATEGTSWPNTSIAASITWRHVPNAPTSFTSTARTNSSISLSWVAPTDNGGSAVNNYRVLYKVRKIGRAHV
jgi:hypothetical protein